MGPKGDHEDTRRAPRSVLLVAPAHPANKNAIYTALVEGHAAEISARRTAMENASNVGFFPRMRRIKADGARHRTHWT